MCISTNVTWYNEKHPSISLSTSTYTISSTRWKQPKKMIGQNEKRTKTESIKASQLGSHYHESGVSVICDQSKTSKEDSCR